MWLGEGGGAGAGKGGGRGGLDLKKVQGFFTSHELCNLASKIEISPPPLPLGGTTSNQQIFVMHLHAESISTRLPSISRKPETIT